MDIETIEKLIKRVESSHVYQVTVSEGNQSITVTNRLPLANNQALTNKQPQLSAEKQPCDLLTPRQGTSSTQQSSTSDDIIEVTSSHVGFIQLAPDLGSETLVKVGDRVEEGQTVAYVDVLSKLLPISSTKAGVVSKVLVVNGDSIEYGQPILQLS